MKTPSVEIETAKLIEKLENQLQVEFGLDFSYQICAKGHTIAASNYAKGKVKPTIKSKES